MIFTSIKPRIVFFLFLFLLPIISYTQSTCEPPKSVRIVSVLSKQVKLEWDVSLLSISTGEKLEVEIAEYPSNNFVKYFFYTNNGGEIPGLKPATRYAIRIKKICAASVSPSLSLGIVRTLSLTEETQLCNPLLNNDLCAALGSFITSQRGFNYLKFSLPNNIPPHLLQYQFSNLVRLRYAKIVGGITQAWTMQQFHFYQLYDGTVELTGLQSNTLYAIELDWKVYDGENVLKNCLIRLNDTPTLGDDYYGPVFSSIAPPITLDCENATPLDLIYPQVSGGCSTPSISFTDAEQGTDCNKKIVRTWVAVDDCGRTSTLTQVVSLKDNQPPSFIDVPSSNITVSCTDNLPNEEPTAVDNCSSVVIALNTNSIAGVGCEEIITRSWIATDACGNTVAYQQTIHVVLEELNAEEPIPPLPVECGVPYIAPPLTNTIALATAKKGDTFTINSIPFVVEEIAGGNGQFSGSGKIRLPFSEKTLYVVFTNIQVNSTYQVLNGQVFGKQDDNFIIPTTQVNFGGDICVPNSPLTQYGFDESGTYVIQPPYEGWQQGDPIDANYDPNGFDANGVHIQTGNQFNPSGCSQEGLDANNNPCNPNTQGPYYWLPGNSPGNNLPATAEGTAYATALLNANPNLREIIKQVLDKMLLDNNTSLSTKRVECTAIKNEVNPYVGTLDRKFLFGENDIYLNEGMSLQFSKIPIPFQAHGVARSTAIDSIESKHLNLYYCDKSVQKYKKTVELIKAWNTPIGLDILVPFIGDEIKVLTQNQIDPLKASQAALKDWIEGKLELRLLSELTSLGYTYTNPVQPINQSKNTHKLNQPDYPSKYLCSSNSLEKERELLAQSFDLRPEDLKFEFDQGFEMINGVHRAFYLEAIAMNRKAIRGNGENNEDPESLMPIKLEKQIGGKTYSILLDKILFTPSVCSLDAYFILDVPSSNQKIVFSAKTIQFGPNGFVGANGVPSGIKLNLATNIGIRLNNTARLIIKGQNNNTFVSVDCNGFAGMGIEAEVEFCREFLLPLDANYKVHQDPAKRVKASFIATMPAWGEFIASLTMERFAPTDHPEYGFDIQNASLDFSDVANPINFSGLPVNYQSEFGTQSNFAPQWKGFFLEQLTVRLPEKLNKNNAGSAPTTIVAEKLVIDDRGLTGLITVNHELLSLDKGNLDGWAYSIDEFKLLIIANRIQGGGFGGNIHVPIFKATTSTSDQITKDDCFRYSAFIISTPAGELYQFTVANNTTPKKMDIAVGEVTLRPTSTIKVSYSTADDKFTIVTDLSGDLTVNGDLGSNTKLEIPKVDFQNLKLSNVAPYWRGGSIGISSNSGSSIGGFGLSVTLPEFKQAAQDKPTQSAFSIGALLRVVSKEDADNDDKFDIAAGTKVRVIGELSVINGRQRWKYKDYEVQQILLEASFKGVELVKGVLDWYKDDDDFGRGIRGQVSINLSGLKKSGNGLGIDALAQFGKKDDFKYFFIDLMVKIPAGNLNVSGIDIRGIGGGVYYHMLRDTAAFSNLESAPNAFQAIPALGVSLSGIKYTPSKQIKLGIKVSTILALPKEDVFNAIATLEISFNETTATNPNGGIRDIAFYGMAAFMAPLRYGGFSSNPTPAAPVSANLAISYDFATKTLHGELAVFANIEGSFMGAGPNFSVGKAVIHFDPEKWYINVGTPTNPLGFKVSIPGASSQSGLLEVKSYICVGTGIPPMPPLPGYVQQITVATNFLANESRRATGKGFALGASIVLSTGDMEFLIFYGHLDLGLGFDINMQKYDNIICANNDNKPLGANGWYAAGQAWAYIDAEIGIKYKGNKFPIMDLSAAAALQMKLPNPFWARGAVGGSYRILGGLVKGNCNFRFTVGKSCEEDGGDELVKLIEELTPADDAENVALDEFPIAYFSVPVNSEVTLYDDEGEQKIYKTYLRNIQMRRISGNQSEIYPYLHTIFEEDKRSLKVNFAQFLPSNTEFEFKAKVEMVPPSGSPIVEEKIVRFKTGSAPQVIPASNIEAQYPVNGMHNFYKHEYNEGGYITLKFGQPELLAGRNLEFRFESKGGSKFTVPAIVSPDYTQIRFAQTPQLLNGTVYKMTLVEPNLLNSTSTGTGAGQNKPENGNENLQIPPDKVLYTSFFRTSNFNKFVDKVNTFKNSSTSQAGKQVFNVAIEPFDQTELEGNVHNTPLVSLVPSGAGVVENGYSANDIFTFAKPWLSENEKMPNMNSSYLVQIFSTVGSIQRPESEGFNGKGESDFPPVITQDLYDSGASGIASAQVSLTNPYFKNYKIGTQKVVKTLVREVYDESEQIIDYEINFNEYFPAMAGICHAQYMPPSYPLRWHCLSPTYMQLGDDKYWWIISAQGNIKPPYNSTHTFYIGYELPGTGIKTTPGMPIQYLHTNQGY